MSETKQVELTAFEAFLIELHLTEALTSYRKEAKRHTSSFEPPVHPTQLEAAERRAATIESIIKKLN